MIMLIGVEGVKAATNSTPAKTTLVVPLEGVSSSTNNQYEACLLFGAKHAEEILKASADFDSLTVTFK